jgi:quaternary ammonium compound-resistance protein SugE
MDHAATPAFLARKDFEDRPGLSETPQPQRYRAVAPFSHRHGISASAEKATGRLLTAHASCPTSHASEDDLPPLWAIIRDGPTFKEDRMAWVYLGIAGLLEVLWAYMLKVSENLSKPVEATIAVVAMIASFIVLSMAMKSLPLGTAYTIWTGIGAVGAFLIGIIVLGEAATTMRIGSAALILVGIIGLKLASSEA